MAKPSGTFSVLKSERNASYTCGSCGKICVNWRVYVYHQKSRHTDAAGKKFTCSLCGRQFYTRHRLRNHTLSHEKGKHYCCHVCGKLFESNKKLNIHSLVHNLSSMHDQNLQCSDCGRKYTDWVPFKQHMKTHGAEGVCYPCGLCEETFPTQYEMEKHKRVHKQFQCEFCDRFFRSASVLSVHLRIHTGERPYKCGLCERDFSQSAVLKVHMRTHAKEGRYECKLCASDSSSRCSRVFVDVMEYFRHHMAHLEEGNLQCEECGKMFSCINDKNRHMAAHRDRSGRQCHVCGKEFGRVSHLEAHMLCHSEHLLLLCKICNKTFSSQELLTAHYSSHLAGDNDVSSSDAALSSNGCSSPLFCGLCGKMFKDQEYLKKHLKKHEKEVRKSNNADKILDEDVTEVDNGQFACGDCGKTFGKAHHLTVHRREHTGECPHSCCICGQNFMLRTQLLQHIREHRRSSVMMYLNLNAGEICTTSSDEVKTVPNPKLNNLSNNAADSDIGTDTELDYDRHEERSETKEMSSYSQQIQKQKGTFSQFEETRLDNDSRMSQHHQVTPQTIQQRSVHHHHYHQQQQQEVSSFTQNHTPSESLSISSSIHGSTSSIHRQVSPISAEKQHLILPTPDMSQQSFSEAISPPHSTPVIKAHSFSKNMSHVKEKHYLYINSNNRDLYNNQAVQNQLTPSQNPKQFSPSVPESAKSDIHIQNNLNIRNRMLRTEPHMPIGMHLSTHQDLKSDVSHHPLPLSYSRAYLAPPIMSNDPTPHHHPPPPLPSNITGQVGRFHPDIQHSLSNFQLLPQTAFPDNSHH